MIDGEDYRYMVRALRLARRGLYTTDPNPRVGCVLVRGGQVVGEGWHERAGGPHAEVHALDEAGERAGGATAYVTLEPCCHHGRTPPCSQALIGAGVTRVVAAMADPNPQVAGQGLAELAAAGVQVESGVLREQAETLNQGFIRRMKTGRPFVRCKLAMSLDGRTAMASGESKWITGEAARRDVQRLRARSSAIMTGIGTVLADDPSMNVRLDECRGKAGFRQPLRVVLDPHLSMAPHARMLAQGGETLVLTACGDPALRGPLERAGARVLMLAHGPDAIDLPGALDVLGGEQINEVLLETGAVLSGAMLQAGLIDELIVYMAPHLMGDAARGLFHVPGLEAMDERLELEIKDIRAFGRDWRITATPCV